MGDIFVDDPDSIPPIVDAGEGFIKHVVCDGARWHVLSWDDYGTHCPEPDCIINKIDQGTSK